MSQKSIFIKNSDLRQIWGLGFITIKTLKDVDNIGAYLSAYLADVELTDDNIGQAFQADINTRISHELNEWLDKRSAETAISKSALVAIAVENYRKETETVSALPAILLKLEEMGIQM